MLTRKKIRPSILSSFIILRYIYFFRFISFESSETKLKIKIIFGNLWPASFEDYRENTIDPFLLNFEFLCQPVAKNGYFDTI